jgi:hypothetical protein
MVREMIGGFGLFARPKRHGRRWDQGFESSVATALGLLPPSHSAAHFEASATIFPPRINPGANQEERTDEDDTTAVLGLFSVVYV